MTGAPLGRPEMAGSFHVMVRQGEPDDEAQGSCPGPRRSYGTGGHGTTRGGIGGEVTSGREPSASGSIGPTVTGGDKVMEPWDAGWFVDRRHRSGRGPRPAVRCARPAPDWAGDLG